LGNRNDAFTKRIRWDAGGRRYRHNRCSGFKLLLLQQCDCTAVSRVCGIRMNLAVKPRIGGTQRDEQHDRKYRDAHSSVQMFHCVPVFY
jgi:hypothetical protein